MKFIPLILLALSFNSFAKDWVVEFQKTPTRKQLKRLSKLVSIERFDDFNSDYFRRAYLVKSSLALQTLTLKLNHISPVIGVEGISQVESFSVQPAKELTRYSSDDQLLSYQWGLVSQGQKVRRDKDDINYVLLEDPAQAAGTTYWMTANNGQSIEISSEEFSKLPDAVANLLVQIKTQTAAADVNYVGFQKLIKNMEPGRDVTVAVLDSGVDLGHPDLKNVIAKNLVECNADGGIDYETREDHDDNGVPGDCFGWNFTVNKNDPHAKLPMDDAGHGSHVAGIIAAESNNATGVSGLGANIKIVPVKVLNEDESSEQAKQIALTDRIARGVLYAIKRNVDVINLSLGWLRQSDTKYLREAVNAALGRGIPVIAAAGNNGANARLYPCAYPGVICVGATNIDGKPADFSNHGGNVDIFVPGDSILSTWPVSIVPLEFSVHGYEIASGTSQATPFVSGAVAQLIAHVPNLSVAQIQARLMLGANADLLKSDPGAGMSGRLDMAKSLSVTEQPVVRPVFKSIDEISYTLKDRKFRFPLPIVNYWQDSKELKITLALENKGVELARSEFSVPQIKQEKSITIPVEGLITDVNADRAAKLVVTIESDGKSMTFSHNVSFVRLLIDDPEVEEKSVHFKDAAKPLGLVQDDKVQPLVTTVESYYGTSAPEWFLRRNSDDGVEMTFFKIEKDQVSEGASFLIAGAKRVLGLMSLDFNYDGKDDRLLQTTQADSEGNENAIIFSFRSLDGRGLYGDYSDWRFEPEVAVANDTLAFTNAEIEGLGHVVSPIFVEQGSLPEAQQPTGFFDERDEQVRKRIYVLDPQKDKDGKIVLKTLALDTNENIETWKEQLGLRWSDPFAISTILSPSLEEHEKGSVRVLISAGFASRHIDAVLTVTAKDKFSLEKINLKGIRPEGQDAVRVSQIDHDRFARHERTGFIGFYDGKRARASVIGTSVATQPYSLKNEFDNYSGHVASFIAGDNLTSVYTTSNRLVMVQDNGQKQKVLERPLERFDFLPGQVFNELFWPIARENAAGELFPSLYVDASSIHTNSVHIIEAREDGFIAPMAQSVLLPPNCKALNPVILPGEKAHRTTMLCLEKERGFVFKFVK